MKALTIWQPYAHYIALGLKKIENRTWAPTENMLKLGDYFAIHAGMRYDKSGAESIRRELGLVVPKHEDLPKGAIVAVAVLDRIAAAEDDFDPAWDDPWFSGPWGWCLRDVVAIEPVPCNGAQKLWYVPDRIVEKVRENFRKARRAA